MQPTLRNGIFQTCAFGLFFASLGFTWALATSPSTPILVTRSAIGTQATRTPTTFVTDSNLGFVVAGSAFYRQIVVQHGFLPHVFSFGPQPLGGATISNDGTLQSAGVSSSTATSNIETDFNVHVLDNVGGKIVPYTDKTFAITSVPALNAPTPFYFVNNGATVQVLPTAVAGAPYSYSISVNGGAAPYQFFILSDADLAAIPAGLTLTPDGVLYGKPILPTPNATPATFTIWATDAIGPLVPQTISLQVLPGTISSEFVATSGQFSLAFGQANGRDSLKLNLALNKVELATAGIRTAADLNGVGFSMKFGGLALPPAVRLPSQGTTTTGISATFDNNGSFMFPNLTTGFIPGNVVTYDVTLNPSTGALTAQFKNIALIEAIGAQFHNFGTTPIIPVTITLTPTASASSQTPFIKTDVLQFSYKRSTGSGIGVTRLSPQLSGGGIFIINKVTGSERQVSNASDHIFLKAQGFIRGPGGAPITPNASDTVSVLFGTIDLGSVPFSSFSQSNNGRLLRFDNNDPSAGLQTLIIDNASGTVFISTLGLDPRALFGQDFLVAGTPYTMPITLNIASAINPTKPTFDGQSSVTLFRKGNSLINK